MGYNRHWATTGTGLLQALGYFRLGYYRHWATLDWAAAGMGYNRHWATTGTGLLQALGYFRLGYYRHWATLDWAAAGMGYYRHWATLDWATTGTGLLQALGYYRDWAATGTLCIVVSCGEDLSLPVASLSWRRPVGSSILPFTVSQP